MGIVTFITILLEWFLLIAGVFDPVFLLVLLVAFLLKSVPDFLILQNTAVRYNKMSLMKWFVPSQIIYPLYIILVSITVPLKRKL